MEWPLSHEEGVKFLRQRENNQDKAKTWVGTTPTFPTVPYGCKHNTVGTTL